MQTYSSLKSRQRRERESYNPFLSVRVHRALSWLARAEQCDDDDGKMVFLWIAFNAAYANEIKPGYRPREQTLFHNFLVRLCQLDGRNRLEEIVWEKFSSTIRVLLDNEYIFQDYWEYRNGNLTQEQWKSRFATAKNSAFKALGKRDTVKVLGVVLSRIYTLRNQLVHGGATWNSRVNRKQIQNCTDFMGHLVPAVIEIMMDNGTELWGEPCYPVVSSE